MIAINWGSSNFRAYKLGKTGNVEAERSSGRGAVFVPPAGFPDAFMAEVRDWVRDGENRVLMCGMVGARQGWREAPYVQLPATFDQIIGSVIRIELNCEELKLVDARIVPGLLGIDQCGIPEVLRGEETELFGSGSDLSNYTHICLPGTHTKWVRTDGARICSFATYMTGDLYKAIREGSILRNCTKEEPTDADAFLAGVARSKQEGELAHHLFGVRTLVLAGSMHESSASSYLSGLLIGHEVRTIARKGETVHLIGDACLSSRYATALHEFEVSSSVEPAGAALRGLQRIARSLAW